MKKLLWVEVLCCSLVAAPAFAANSAPAKPAAPRDWAGFYAGGQLGYAFGQFDSYSTNLVGTFPVPFGHHSSAFRAGVHAGYSYQFYQFVVGVEGSIGFGVGNSEQRTPAFGVVYTAKTRSNFDGSIRLRVGYVFDNLLVYGTGGVSFGNVRAEYGCDGCVDAASAQYAVSGVRLGWTAGAGAEYMFNENWSARLEYKYTSYGSKTEVFPSPIVAISHDNTFKENRVMLGVSYHFR